MNWIKYKNQPLINLDNIDIIDDKTVDCLKFYATGSDEASQWKFENSAERDKIYKRLKLFIVEINLEDLKSDE